MQEEQKIKHLEMIEEIITRMSGNSFQLKGWTVTLVVAIISLSEKFTKKGFFIIALYPLIVFWAPDSYYLMMERKYKILYKNVVENKDEKLNFNMDTRKIICSCEDCKRICYFHCLFSKTEWPFYFLPILGLIIIKVFHLL